MYRTFDQRLRALEALEQHASGDHVFVASIDDDPARYTIDGVEVSAGDWHERAMMAGADAFVVQVEYEDGWRGQARE